MPYNAEVHRHKAYDPGWKNTPMAFDFAPMATYRDVFSRDNSTFISVDLLVLWAAVPVELRKELPKTTESEQVGTSDFVDMYTNRTRPMITLGSTADSWSIQFGLPDRKLVDRLSAEDRPKNTSSTNSPVVTKPPTVVSSVPDPLAQQQQQADHVKALEADRIRKQTELDKKQRSGASANPPPLNGKPGDNAVGDTVDLIGLGDQVEKVTSSLESR